MRKPVTQAEVDEWHKAAADALVRIKTDIVQAKHDVECEVDETVCVATAFLAALAGEATPLQQKILALELNEAILAEARMSRVVAIPLPSDLVKDLMDRIGEQQTPTLTDKKKVH